MSEPKSVVKPRDAYGRYGCVPRDLHPAWFDVSWSARAIGMAMFALVDDFSTRRIDTHGNWQDSVCKRLCIPGKERRYVKPALDSLVELGLITVCDHHVIVNIAPTALLSGADSVLSACRVGADSVLTGLPVDSDGPTKATQVSENNQDQILQHPSKQSIKAILASKHAPACETKDVDIPLSSAPEHVGYRWLDATLGGGGVAPDLCSWRSEYERIGRKPEAERAIVAKHMLASDYIVAERRKAKPDHLLRFWGDFVASPRNVLKPFSVSPRKGFTGPSRVPTDAEYEEDARACAANGGVIAW